jgi:hypothetical protein
MERPVASGRIEPIAAQTVGDAVDAARPRFTPRCTSIGPNGYDWIDTGARHHSIQEIGLIKNAIGDRKAIKVLAHECLTAFA